MAKVSKYFSQTFVYNFNQMREEASYTIVVCHAPRRCRVLLTRMARAKQ